MDLRSLAVDDLSALSRSKFHQQLLKWTNYAQKHNVSVHNLALRKRNIFYTVKLTAGKKRLE